MSELDLQQAKQRTQNALQALAELAVQQQGTPFKEALPFPPDSSLNNEKVQNVLQSVSQPEQFRSFFVCRNVLNGGELSPHLNARYDLPKYKTGCKELLNMVPLPQGGITKRPGLEYIGESKKGSKFIPFVSSVNDCLMLEVDPSLKLKAWSLDGKSTDTGVSLPQGVKLDQLSFAQSADVIFCACPTTAPFKIMRYPDHWEMVRESFQPIITGAAMINCLKSVPYFVAKEGRFPDKNDGITTYYAITSIQKDTGVEATVPIDAMTYQGWEPSTSVWVEFDFKPIPEDSNTAEYRIYKKANGVFGYIGSAQGGDVFLDKGIKPDTQDTLPDRHYSIEGQNPSIVFLHQQRLGFAAGKTKPLTIWLSQSGMFESFATRKPPKDDDAIEVTLASTQANKILWAMPDRNALAIGTEGAEWTLTGGGESSALTPSNVSFQSQSFHGSQNNVEVLRAGTGLTYVQRGGHTVREFGYSFQSDKYQSDDLSILARHILRNASVVSWAWQGEPHSIIWMVLSNGTCAALTYMKDHDIVAWHRHTTQFGKFLDVETIPGKDGNDQVWFHIKRTDPQTKKEVISIERLSSFVESPDPSKYNHVDGKQKLPFVSRCIPTMPEMDQQNGSSLMRVRKINSLKCRVMNSMPFQVQIGNSDPMLVPIRGDTFVDLADWTCPIAGRWREGDDIEFLFDGKDPVTLLAVTAVMELADMGGSQQ